MTVAMIWPWALVNNCGVIGCTWRPWAPPAAWLEGTGLGISGIVPIIWRKQHRNGKWKNDTNLPHKITHFTCAKLNLRWNKHRERGMTRWVYKKSVLCWGDEGLQNHLSSHISPMHFNAVNCNLQQVSCVWECTKLMLGHALAPWWCFVVTSHLDIEWSRCKYQSHRKSCFLHCYSVLNCELMCLCNFLWFTVGRDTGSFQNTVHKDTFIKMQLLLDDN